MLVVRKGVDRQAAQGRGPMSNRRSARTTMIIGVAAGALAGGAGAAAAHAMQPPFRKQAPTVTMQQSGTGALLQAVSAADSLVVWVAGRASTYLRTVDGGATWKVGTIAEEDSLQLRDVHAVDAETAYVLSAGSGERARIYKTEDGGRHWRLQYSTRDPRVFLNCMDFWDHDRGVAFSDPVGRHFLIIRTGDGGRHWDPAPSANTPVARPDEVGYAASGTCLVAEGNRYAWFATGAGGIPRVFRTTDGGDTWSVTETPLVPGRLSAGILSLVFRDPLHGLVLGGDIRDAEHHTDNIAVTTDGGRTWSLTGRPQFTGAVYGAAYVPGTETPTIVAVGPKGVDYSVDNGATWIALGRDTYWGVDFAGGGAGWIVGPQGRIARVRMR